MRAQGLCGFERQRWMRTLKKITDHTLLQGAESFSFSFSFFHFYHIDDANKEVFCGARSILTPLVESLTDKDVLKVVQLAVDQQSVVERTIQVKVLYWRPSQLSQKATKDGLAEIEKSIAFPA